MHKAVLPDGFSFARPHSSGIVRISSKLGWGACKGGLRVQVINQQRAAMGAVYPVLMKYEFDCASHCL